MPEILMNAIEKNEIIEIKPIMVKDDRGRVIKHYSYEDFVKNNINFIPVESTVLISKTGVIRGLHFQKNFTQDRLITCVQGDVWLVAVNVDKNDLNYGKWYSFDMLNGDAVYISGKYAVGSLSIVNSVLIIAYNEKYISNLCAGIKWDDKTLGIPWPLNMQPIVSEKDANLPSFLEW